MDTVYKIMAIAVKNRLNGLVEMKIGQYQCGFLKNMSVMDQVFILKQVVENGIDQNLPLYMTFIDFKQTYDTVKREKLYSAIKDIRIKEELLRLVKMKLCDIVIMVRSKENLINAFKKFEKSAKDKGLTINEHKTRFMVVEKGQENIQNRKINIDKEGSQYCYRVEKL